MSLIFEALPARYGDSLFLTFEDPARTLRMLVDGGPSRVYATSVKPRLLKEKADAGGSLTLDAVMVSHIDEDHVLGLIDLFSELQDADQGHRPRPWNVRWLLHNSFDALLGEGEGGAARAVGGETVLAGLGGAQALSALLTNGLDHTAELVLQSYSQGSKLASLAAALRITRNPPDGSPIMSTTVPRVLKLGEATITIVGPREKELEKLRKGWKDWLDEQAAKPTKPPTAALAATLDTSVPNLSSIVALVEHGGRKVLLTGDARADYIFDGLESADLTQQGTLHVDVLKLPHHGSIRNITKAFLQKVTADHYVASGDGTYGNPDRATLELIEATRPNGGYTVHITNDAAACDQGHDAWRRSKGLGPLDVAKDGIAPVIAAWRQAGLINVQEGPVRIAF